MEEKKINAENKPEMISYFTYEAAMGRMERQVQRLFILCIIIFSALVATNIGWIIYDAQYEDAVTITQEVQTDTSPAYVNGTGEMNLYGEDKTNNN